MKKIIYHILMHFSAFIMGFFFFVTLSELNPSPFPLTNTQSYILLFVHYVGYILCLEFFYWIESIEEEMRNND